MLFKEIITYCPYTNDYMEYNPKEGYIKNLVKIVKIENGKIWYQRLYGTEFGDVEEDLLFGKIAFIGQLTMVEENGNLSLS